MLLEIKSLTISSNDIPEIGASRNFKVTGDNGARFIMVVADGTGKFYDFKTNTFSLGHSSSKVLRSFVSNNYYSGFIQFPNVSGANYNIILTADPAEDVDFGNKTFIKKGVIVKKIKQLGNVTLTISLAPITNTSSYKTLPDNIVSENNPAISGSIDIPIEYTIENAETDANGFGLITPTGIDIVSGEFDVVLSDKCFYAEATTSVVGTTSSSNSVIVNSIDNIEIGMTHSGGGSVINIDTATKKVTFRSAQSLTNGAAIVFQARGLAQINSAFNCNISAYLSFQNHPKTYTVRGSVSSSTTITLNGTYGIPGGDVATYFGTSVNNSTTNTITRNRTASGNNVASASAGEIVGTLAQTFKGGEKFFMTHVLHPFQQVVANCDIGGVITINKYPSADLTLKFDLDTAFTPGVTA